MEIQHMTPSPAISTTTTTTTTPYTTAPSSPHRFPTIFYSAPTSPIHSLVAFHHHHHDTDDFAFNFTGPPQPPSISAADELFHAGKIKPLTPLSDHPPKSPPFDNKKFNSFTQTFHRTPGDHYQTNQNPPKRVTETATNTTRIKDKASRSSSSSSSSSSAFRISDILSDEDANQRNAPTWYSKWNLKNLILFRSVSEGSARRSKDPVSKYSRVTKGDEDVRNSSFRSADGCSRKKVSAHEMHYTANRAAAEEMRRKTYLPYKSGLFGCLGFHNNGAGGVHQMTRGFASVIRQR